VVSGSAVDYNETECVLKEGVIKLHFFLWFGHVAYETVNAVFLLVCKRGLKWIHWTIEINRSKKQTLILLIIVYMVYNGLIASRNLV